MQDAFNLKGKKAIITGGNRGIGKAIACAFARAGYDMLLAARNEAKLAEAAAEVRKLADVTVQTAVVNLRSEEQINALVKTALDSFGQVDILVNNAGINIRKMPDEISIEEWDEVMEVNVRGSFLAARAVYPSMKKAGGGKIVNLGSMASIFGGKKVAAYSASKGGVVQLTRSLAVAWGPDNIQVNAILPGWIATELTERAKSALPGLNEHVLMRTPAGRWGCSDDVAGLAVFLSSRASDFITGAAIPVDGGFSVMIL